MARFGAVICSRGVKLLREILSYIAYMIAVTLVAMLFAARWHDFMAAYHVARHPEKMPGTQNGTLPAAR